MSEDIAPADQTAPRQASPAPSDQPLAPTLPSKRRLLIILTGLTAIGPFSVDTYLPSFHAIAVELNTPLSAVQQTLTVYMVAFGVMTLWHGALADRFGRRRILLIGLLGYALASILCALAGSISTLMMGRIAQGLFAGAGIVITRAVVRDVFSGIEAQRMLSSLSIIFPLAPAFAPIWGGFLHITFGWRSIFVFLFVFSVLLGLLCFLKLPETLPEKKRQSLRPWPLLQSYIDIARHREFQKTAFAMALGFLGFFIYIAAAPVFIIEHLHLREHQFYWIFLPFTGGMLFGALLANRMIGRWSARAQINLSGALMIGAALLNVGVCLIMPPTLPWSILFLPLYTIGIALATPILTVRALDCFPERRGMASSCLSFLQVSLAAIVVGVIAPALWHSSLALACWTLLASSLSVWCAVSLRPMKPA